MTQYKEEVYKGQNLLTNTSSKGSTLRKYWEKICLKMWITQSGSTVIRILKILRQVLMIVC